MGQSSVSSVHLPILKVYLNVYKLGKCDELGLSDTVLMRLECVTLSQGKSPPEAKWETRPLLHPSAVGDAGCVCWALVSDTALNIPA